VSSGTTGRWRNGDVDWDRWPVPTYLAENYRELHGSDDAVIVHHSAFYRGLAAGGVARAVEVGTGPNLYPLFLASGAARHIDAVDAGAAGLRYLRAQLAEGPDPSWEPFWARCRALNPALPATMTDALRRVRAMQGDAFALAGADYDLASMHVVAESVTEDPDEFAGFCAAFVATVRPGATSSRRSWRTWPATSWATARAGRACRSTARPWRRCSVRSRGTCGSRGSTPTRGCRTTATPGWCC